MWIKLSRRWQEKDQRANKSVGKSECVRLTAPQGLKLAAAVDALSSDLSFSLVPGLRSYLLDTTPTVVLVLDGLLLCFVVEREARHAS